MQSYFNASDFPRNMPAIWEQHFGQFVQAGHAVVLGEFGGKFAAAAAAPVAAARAVRKVHAAWNGFTPPDEAAKAWHAWRAARPELEAHALRWQKNLQKGRI